ncbi:MAG: SCO family protein, partial [Tepidisphaeraceae bacterium]
GPCPQMTRSMTELQTALPQNNLHFVSITVDPDRDTPQALREYATTYTKDLSRWTLLTGTRQQTFDVALGMKLAAKPASEDQPILHSTRFLLVDASGHVRGLYDGTDEQGRARLIDDAAALCESVEHAKGAAK